MAFDFKKEYKEFYMPKNKPQIVNVPKANYIAVRGKGNPNEEGGAYQQAISVLYAVAYTVKMSYKTDYKIEGFFEYVVPPLEGFWWQDDVDGVDYSDKSTFNWISVIRLPDFVSKTDFEWAVATATKKKKLDCSSAEFLTIEEGLCVQIMHADDIELVVVGGESDKFARPFDYDWALDIREQCIRKNVSFEFRQCGTRFIKDGKEYKLQTKDLCSQARKAGIDFIADR